MPESLNSVLARLERVATYDGPWRPMRDAAPLLRERVKELRERENRLDDLLVVALVGGSGVGKSTLLNALAGDELAPTSEFRPCTSLPTVYHPPGARLQFEGWRHVSGSALEHLILIDTPDSDTVVHEHREMVIDALAHSDLILMCGSPEKYLDEATWSLLRPLRQERAIVCVETKAHEQGREIRAHWLASLKETGFEPAAYFRVNALRALDRKLTGAEPTKAEFDFEPLEVFLRDSLSREQIQRIKRSNAAGLLRKALAGLHEQVAGREESLTAVQSRLDTLAKDECRQAFDTLAQRLFAEAHLWAYALGRETSLRAKGIVGTLYRVLEFLRGLPTRVATWLPWTASIRGGRQAAAMLAGTDPASSGGSDTKDNVSDGLFAHNLGIAVEELATGYAARQSEVALTLAQAGFDRLDAPASREAFQQSVAEQLTRVLRGPGRDRIVKRARWLTSWPATFLADVPPLAFLAYSGYAIVKDYFAGIERSSDSFLHAGVVLALLLAIELTVISLLGRMLAWTARRGARRDLRLAVLAGVTAFEPERKALEDALTLVREIRELDV